MSQDRDKKPVPQSTEQREEAARRKLLARGFTPEEVEELLHGHGLTPDELAALLSEDEQAPEP